MSRLCFVHRSKSVTSDILILDRNCSTAMYRFIPSYVAIHYVELIRIGISYVWNFNFAAVCNDCSFILIFRILIIKLIWSMGMSHTTRFDLWLRHPTIGRTTFVAILILVMQWFDNRHTTLHRDFLNKKKTNCKIFSRAPA